MFDEEPNVFNCKNPHFLEMLIRICSFWVFLQSSSTLSSAIEQCYWAVLLSSVIEQCYCHAGDAWILFTDTLCWSQLSVPDTNPRLWHTACLSQDGDILIFGGCCSDILNYSNRYVSEQERETVRCALAKFFLCHGCRYGPEIGSVQNPVAASWCFILQCFDVTWPRLRIHCNWPFLRYIELQSW